MKLLASLVVALLLSASLAAADPPNVIVILSDDQGYGDFGCHGNPVLKTPNLDKLHGESVRLTDFHVAPMCTPTRGQLLTGVDAVRNGATSVCAGRTTLRAGIPTAAEIFDSAGYKTAMFGKWHLGDSYPNLPHFKGFHESVYHLSWGITSLADTWENDYFDGRFYHNGTLKQYKGYCTDVWFDLSMAWMKERQAKKEPFFLYLPTNAPHGPLWVAEKYRKPYEKKGPAAFFGMIANLDENMGRLDKFLRDTGLRDNTIVVFFNDNGGTAGVQTFNAGMRGRKTMYYDGGHRAACFLRWPNGKLGKPRDIDQLTQVQDLLPTLMDLCSVQRARNEKIDGKTLAGLLTGTQEKLPDRMLVVQYGQKPEKWDSCVMWNKWRLVKGEELYDLKTDPAQEKNVAEKHADVFKKMREHYEGWWKKVEPLVDQFNPLVIGSDKANPTRLTSAEWANIYCDNSRDLRTGAERNGPWHIAVEKDGTYEIRLRRWPKEADAAISGSVPVFKAAEGELPAGKALPIARMRLKVGDLDAIKPVDAKDKEILFTVKLKAGQKLTMQSWCYDADGKELCGAYYAYIERK